MLAPDSMPSLFDSPAFRRRTPGCARGTSIAVATKALGAQKIEGQNALALIASATPAPLQPGHRLSVVA